VLSPVNNSQTLAGCLELCGLDAIIGTVFETLQAPHSEPANNWASIYWFWCVLGAVGFIMGFWKHGAYRSLGMLSYAAVFVLALYFIVTARTSPPTRRGLSIRCTILLWLSLTPTTVHLFLT
jgi:hypothetical protein